MNKKIILFLTVCLLAGCAQTPMSTTQHVSWQYHLQQLENLKDWSFNGKIAIITPQERHSLNIHWQQSNNDLHIILTTFLGNTVFSLEKTKNMTQIIDNNGKHYYGEDTKGLIKQLSGLVIPVQALQQWVKGNPSDATYLLNDNNQVISLSGIDSTEVPWQINYNRYTLTQGVYLPQQIQLQQGDIRLKFAISKWNIKTI